MEARRTRPVSGVTIKMLSNSSCPAGCRRFSTTSPEIAALGLFFPFELAEHPNREEDASIRATQKNVVVTLCDSEHLTVVGIWPPHVFLETISGVIVCARLRANRLSKFHCDLSSRDLSKRKASQSTFNATKITPSSERNLSDHGRSRYAVSDVFQKAGRNRRVLLHSLRMDRGHQQSPGLPPRSIPDRSGEFRVVSGRRRSRPPTLCNCS